ncbi:phage BR0599 family protein [Zestomonas carbonaria]|uniref:Bacteriophage phiJL001 Gp84 C-terminal domain-containing protein n=1 Tax=Zestomonas carbonaria TaxID=2762745 RepID=A0A7U7I8E5_9GAMM|nr:phage BR0599 family protein [Pseudomonas carbonaria]CAD5107244.1 hypothetical protein PSEWESI4_01515 [Pseudomonas carbonaria]
MSFNDRERSLSSGKPIRLYEFSRGVLRWLYASGDRDITLGTQVFRALRGGISDGGLRQSGQTKQDDFTITAPADIEVAQPFRNVRPSAEIGVRVFDMHYGDGESVCRYVGTIANVRWPRLDTCTITCTDIDAGMDRPGLVDTFSRSCTTYLYSTRCKVNRDLHRVLADIQGIAELSISSGTFAGYPAGWFSGGYIEWAIGGGEYEQRHIDVHAGSNLQLLGGTAGLALGMSLRVYPGCDYLVSTCHDKFENLLNFRGQPHMDGKSPFDGDQVY